VVVKNSTSTNKSAKKVKKKSTQKKKTSSKKAVRILGIDKGKVIIKPDFDAPLPEFEENKVHYFWAKFSIRSAWYVAEEFLV
jgi:hypothetical protein